MNMPLSGKATVDAIANEWGKLFAIYLFREGIKEVVIGMPDIQKITEDATQPTIVVQELGDGLHIKILPINQAIKLAKENKRGFGKS